MAIDKSKLQLQIAQISGGGQIPVDQVAAINPAAGVSSLNALTGGLLITPADASIDIQTPIPSVITVSSPTAIAAAAAANTAQGTANDAIANAATAQTTANTALANAATAQGTADGAVTVNVVQTQNIQDVSNAVGTKAPINNPQFTGVVHAENGGAGPTIGWAGTGGEYGFRYDDVGNKIEVWRAGVVILIIDIDALSIGNPTSPGGGLVINGDTGFGRDAGSGSARIDNGVGCKVSAGLSEWNHSVPPSQPVGGPATAGIVYGATEQTMLQVVYDALRGKGTIS